MTIKGITGKEENIINSILKNYFDKYEFYYYGSRVKGNYRFLSDLDILVKSENTVLPDDIDILRTLFDNSNLPYIVSITDYSNIDETFYNLIKNDLVRIVIKE